MRRQQFPCSGSGWQAQVLSLMSTALPLADYGRTVTRRMLAGVLLWVSAARATVSDAAQRTGVKVSDETLRLALRASLPEIEQLPRLIELSFSAWLPKARRARRKRGFDVAVDVHHQPFYGRSQPGVFRGQAKFGTKLFWSTATAVIVERGERLTLDRVAPICSGSRSC